MADARDLASLRLNLAEQRLYVSELFDACCLRDEPELFGSMALEPLIEINATRARIEALLYPGKRWMESVERH